MLFLEFRPITRGRLCRSRVVFWGLFLAALALYGWLMPHGAAPGESATWIARAARIDAREVPTHPLLIAIGGWAAGFSWLTLPVRLNLLAAVAGALCVGWVYKLVWFLTFELMREESAVTHASKNARFAGLAAACAVAVSLPVCQAATRFQPEIFDVALLMACACLLTVYARSKNVGWLLLFGALYGAGTAESPLFIVAAPVMAAFAIMTEWKLEWCRVPRLFASAAMSMLVFGGVHYAAAKPFATGPALRDMARVVVAVWRDQISTISHLLPHTLWFPVLVLGVGAAALSYLAAFRSLDNRRSWSMFFLNVVLTVFAALLLFNAPFSPYGVAALAGKIPAATYVFAGIGIGLLAASWRALAVLDDPLDVDIPHAEEDDEDDEQSELPAPRVFAASRGIALLLMPVLLIMVVLGGVMNIRKCVNDDGDFADRAADVVLDGLGERSWILANGLLDPNILIRAHERGKTVRLLCPYRAREPRYKAWVLRAFQADPSFSENAKLRAQSLVNYNFYLFIDDLFASDEAIGAKAVCMGLPDVWYGAGWTPVPERLFFGGVRSAQDLKTRDLMTPHVAFWKDWKPFLDAGDGPVRNLSYRFRGTLRRHFAFVANNLGVALEDAGKPEQAFDAYRAARAFYDDNISALLNLFEMVSRGYHPEMKESVGQQLRLKVDGARERYPLWALSRHYGYVRNYDIFVKMGWSWALSSSPGSVLAGLRSAYTMQHDEERRAALTAMMASIYEMRGDFTKSASEYRKTLKHDPQNAYAISGLARLALQQSVVGDARKILEEGEAAGAPKRLLRQDWAAIYLVSGDLPRARVLLQEIAEEPEASPMALSMLAMVMLEQQDIGAVETKVLPRLSNAAKGKDSYFVQVVQGRVWQSKGTPEGFKNARLCFHRASLIRPDVQALQEVLLTLDVALEDQRAAEAHALTILRQRQDHPYANFIMGSIRLEQGQFGDAESYLRRSTAGASPTLAALNNFAQVLCRIRKLDEAESVARRATERATDRYEAWSTLAFVLAEKGDEDGAAQALERARSFKPNDLRLFMVDARIAIKRGDAAAAERALALLREDTPLSVAEKRELEDLREGVMKLRQSRP